jgi:rfaE bifunctional protein nucleotidyltransferase chain/domain
MVPNADEARRLAGDGDGADDEAVAARLASRFGCSVALTTGGAGAVLAAPGRPPRRMPTAPASGDPCGAGDRFAASLAVARARGTGTAEAVAAAVEDARRQVLAGFRTGAGRVAPGLRLRLDGDGGAVPDDPATLAARVRAGGGTVVVAGGCFDVLHAGHVRLLETARRLGDCLIVCVNGDLSVRRLKGRHRPVNPVEDRVAVLAALAPVDAVTVFEEDTPAEALAALRPHVFVKGADHADAAGGEIPEAVVLRRWGGEVVFVPLVPGRSTTRILQAAATGTTG